MAAVVVGMVDVVEIVTAAPFPHTAGFTAIISATTATTANTTAANASASAIASTTARLCLRLRPQSCVWAFGVVLCGVVRCGYAANN